MQQLTMAISGMTCGGCVSAVRKALGTVPGVRIDEVTVGSATISYEATRTTPAAIAQVVRDAGYEPVTADAVVTPGPTRAAGGGCCGGGTDGD